ncbi:phage major capsid protein [Rummeliibacillus pycnus]|uniref:phage major capsid protein n=1 Tax=Rummeliibacillus pycnus TaxID=101070 RepID=UPI000C9AB57F|nr:phage major capsid protein [Rummeliibacillus pycnus]
MEILKTNNFEVRAIEENNDGSLQVKGYVNKTEKPSQPLKDVNGNEFIEVIAKGAFAEALRQGNDVDFLAEHDKQKILASTNNGSLQLREDEQGLYIEATITPTSWGNDYFTLIKSGILKNMSFGFRSLKDSWQKLANGMYQRTIQALELFEVSAVKTPAYQDSIIQARSLETPETIEIPNIPQKSSEERSNSSMKKLNSVNPEQSLNTIIKENRALQTTTDGAAVIPEQIANTIVQEIEDISPVFAMAQKFPTMSGSLKVAREGNDDVVAAFVGEGVDLVEQQLKLEYAELKQKRVGAAITLSNQLINDAAVNMDQYVPNLLARKVAKAIEKSMLVGVGTDEFNGIINDVAIGHVDVTGAITYDTLQDLYLSIHPEFLAGACFVMQRDFFKTIAKLKDNDGHFFLQNGIVNGKVSYTLFDIPVYVTEALSAETPVVFGNINEAVAVMIKQEQGLREIVDSGLALKGAKMYLFDAYMDSIVVNPQAVAKLNVQVA